MVVKVIVSLDFQFSNGQGLDYTGRNPKLVFQIFLFESNLTLSWLSDRKNKTSWYLLFLNCDFRKIYFYTISNKTSNVPQISKLHQNGSTESNTRFDTLLTLHTFALVHISEVGQYHMNFRSPDGTTYQTAFSFIRSIFADICQRISVNIKRLGSSSTCVWFVVTRKIKSMETTNEF